MRFSVWVSEPNVLETDLQGALDQHFVNWKCSRYNLAIHMPHTKYWSSVDKAIVSDTSAQKIKQGNANDMEA